MPAEFTSVAAGLGGLCLVLIVLLGRLIRVMGALRRIEQRLNQLGDALTLLTEASERGFAAVGAELSRLGETGARRAARRTSTPRVSAAARKGQSVQQIAAAEQISEGEVRLRLHLADAARRRPRKDVDDGHALRI